MYSKKNTFIAVLLLILVFIGGSFAGYQYSNYQIAKKDSGITDEILTSTDLDVKYLAYVYEYVLATHVRDDLDKDEMKYNAIKGMLKDIDGGLTRYQTAKEFEDSNRLRNRGDYAGIGVVINSNDGVYTVVSPYKDSPADKAGLKAGDIISQVNGQSVDGWSIDKLGDTVRGKIGTDVTLTIIPAKDKVPYEVTIKRAKIVPPVVEYELVGTNNDIGHVSLFLFNDHSAKQIEDAVNEVINKGAKKLILDLRGNPGGNLTACLDIADLFLGKDKTVFTTVDRTGNKKPYITKYNQKFDIPLYLLINKGSASASEVITGTIMDNKRGISIGMNSYGKASMQTGYNMPDGGVLWVTTNTYRTPNGSYIDKVGIKPNIEIPESVYEEADKNTEKDIILDYTVNWIEKNE